MASHRAYFNARMSATIVDLRENILTLPEDKRERTAHLLRELASLQEWVLRELQGRENSKGLAYVTGGLLLQEHFSPASRRYAEVILAELY